MIVVHVTHEAVEKIGGIGTVIEGLTTAEPYGREVSRTILLGPLFSTDRTRRNRLGPKGKIIYSTPDGIAPSQWRERFSPIEQTYDVGIIYGTREIPSPSGGMTVSVEVLLVDVFHANQEKLNLFKGELFRKFGVSSQEFEDIWEYEQYVRLAEPGIEGIKAIVADAGEEQVVLLGHEYMGIPTALRAVLDGSDNLKTVFYAHEVASVRRIVEDQPGHDTMFYNMMGPASREGKTLEDVFPQVREDFKHSLVKAGRYCDRVFAVGDRIVSELRFLDGHFARKDIDLVYNGIPAEPLSPSEKHASRSLLKKYAANLFGSAPTWVFTHVARPVLSKGIWRDLRVLHELDPLLSERGETVVYFMLGSLGGQRRRREVRRMEREYGWPVTHEVGYPDLCGGEEVVAQTFEVFNREHPAARAVLINQWGWSEKACGRRMAKEMTFSDLRRGTDLEFGLSVYEPFGISQLEPLSFGALCVVSNVCGCMGFVRATKSGGGLDNILEADFLHLPAPKTPGAPLSPGDTERDEIESVEGRRMAESIIERLPRAEQTVQRRISDGYELARRMSWDHVVQEYFLPGLNRATQ